MRNVKRSVGSRSWMFLPVLVTACAGEATTSTSDNVTGPTTCLTIQRGTGGTVEDSFIKANALKKNFGGRPHLRVSAKEESLLRFDLSGIPASSTIVSSTLKL